MWLIGQLLKPEQIVTLLRQIDDLTTSGKTLAQACIKVGTVEKSYVFLYESN